MAIARSTLITAGVTGTVGGLLASGLVVLIGQLPAHETIDSLSRLLWPLVVLTIAFWYRKPFENVLARIIRAKFPGGEVELVQGTAPQPGLAIERQRTAMEYKILKTLWTKQVNRYPKYEALWTFRINWPSEEYSEFREAASKLIGERLVGEADNGQVFLTLEGFKYCKGHHTEFPSEEWWPEEKLDSEKLKIALESK